MKKVGKELENMGGVVRLWAVDKWNISLLGRAAMITNEDDVYCIDITQDTSGAAVNQKTDFAGTTFLHEITGYVSGYDKDSEININQMIRIKKFVVIYMDSNGTLVMLGTPDIPIRFSADFETGETNASKRGFKIKFSGNVHFPPLRLSENPFS